MIVPYLVFNGDCQQAIDFYQSVFPCDEPKVLNYGEYMPEGSITPQELLRTWILHGEMTICGTKVWFADEATPFTKGNSIKLTSIVPTEKEAVAIFNALCEGGSITLPPHQNLLQCLPCRSYR